MLEDHTARQSAFLAEHNEEGAPDGVLELWLALGEATVSTLRRRSDGAIVYAPALRFVRLEDKSYDSAEEALKVAQGQQAKWLEEFNHLRDQIPADVLAEDVRLALFAAQEERNYLIRTALDFPSFYVSPTKLWRGFGSDDLSTELFEWFEPNRGESTPHWNDSNRLLEPLWNVLPTRVQAQIMAKFTPNKADEEDEEEDGLSQRDHEEALVEDLSMVWRQSGLFGMIVLVETPVREYRKGVKGFSFSWGYLNNVYAYLERWDDREALHKHLDAMFESDRAEVQDAPDTTE